NRATGSARSRRGGGPRSCSCSFSARGPRAGAKQSAAAAVKLRKKRSTRADARRLLLSPCRAFGGGDVVLDADEAVRRDGHRIDAGGNEKLDELRPVARCLAAEANLAAGGVRRVDDGPDHARDRRIALVEQALEPRRIAVDAEHELRQVIAADREPVETHRELV